MHSPTRTTHHSRRNVPPPGFRVPPRPKPRPIHELSVRELRDLHERNKRILASPGASTSTYASRVTAEQVAIEARLFELEGIEDLNVGMKDTRINEDAPMIVDNTKQPTSRILQAKRKALSQASASSSTQSASLSLQEAIQLEQQAHQRDKERHERLLEKRQKMGLPIKGEAMSNAERQARIYAFMNYKPTDSDLEDDDEEEDSDDEDIASWFEDEDGVKGQNIVAPDEDDYQLHDVIRIDEARIPYSGVYFEGHD